MLADYVRLVLRSLGQRRLRSWLTVIGVVIGIAAVVSLIGLGEGLTRFVTSQFGIIGADTITVQASGTGFGPPGAGVVNPLTENQRRRVLDVPGVDVVIGRLIETGSLEFNNKVEFGYAASVPDGESRDELYRLISLKASEGRLIEDGDGSKIMIGSELQDKEMWGKELSTGTKVLVNGKEFTVVGVMEKKGSFVVDTTVWMNEQPLRDLFDAESDEYDVFAVRVKQGVDLDQVVERIKHVLRRERNVDEGEEDFRVETSQAALEALESTLFGVQLFVYLIAAVSILVGGIGITNTMYTAILERTPEIGTMKAIGARNRDVFTIFAIESGFIGLIGGGIGVALGAAISHLVALAGRALTGLDLIQAHTSATLILSSLAFSFLIGLAAGMLPAYQASRMHPVEALAARK